MSQFEFWRKAYRNSAAVPVCLAQSTGDCVVYVVIGSVEGKLDCWSAESAARALKLRRKCQEALYERTTVTDGERFLNWTEIESAANA